MLQRREPQHLGVQFWAYKDHVLAVKTKLYDPAPDVLMSKHYMLSRERDFERLKREVEALENLEKLERVSRAPIAESVRLFVWQRDGGQCVRCGTASYSNLITSILYCVRVKSLRVDVLTIDFRNAGPFVSISKGGSSTERNLQLLCEPCNRSKEATI
jgi:HNH endonuclease